MPARPLHPVLALAAVAVVLAGVPAGGTGHGPSGDDECAPHPPIRVTEDVGPQGFILGREPVTGQPVYRPGSGVTAGDGTAEDPYVIQNWCVAPGPDGDSTTGIAIQGTTAHAVVRDSLVDGLGEIQAKGVVVQDAANVTLEENEVSGNSRGILVEGSDDVRVRENEITRNDRLRSDGAALEVVGSNGTAVAGNVLEENDQAVHVEASPNTTFVDNTVEENYAPVLLEDADHATITDNTVTNNSRIGLEIEASSDATVTNNTVTGNEGTTAFFSKVGGGVSLADSPRAHLENNTIRDNANRPGLELARSPNATLAGNTVTGNDRELVLEESPFATMRRNAVDGDGLVLVGDDLRDHQHTVDANNTVGGDPLRYLRGRSDAVVTAPAGQVLLVNTTGAHVDGLELSETHSVLKLAYTRNTTVSNTTVTDSGTHGIEITAADGTTIRNNTILDSKRNGVDIRRSSGITVENNTIAGNDQPSYPRVGGGVVVASSTNATVTGNNVTDNQDNGVFVRSSKGTTVADNAVDGNRHGVKTWGSSGTTVTGNALGNGRGDVRLARTTDAVLRDNAMGTAGLEIAGGPLEHYQHDVDATNTVDGEPLRYHRDAADVDVASPAGQVFLVNTTDARVAGLDVSDLQDTAVHLVLTRNTTLADNTIARNGFSTVVLDRADGIHLEGNTVENNWIAVHADGAENVTVTGNTFTSNHEGIYLDGAPRASIANNTLTGNGLGLLTHWAVELNVTNNTFRENGNGAQLSHAMGATVADNVFADNTNIGVLLTGTKEADLHRNNIHGNGLFGLNVWHHHVDARDNWWGADDGPSGNDEDACTDAVADGNGDAIYTKSGGEVCFDPWLTSPNPDAGAGG